MGKTDLLRNAFFSDGERSPVDGGPARRSGEAVLVSDPPDVGSGVGKNVDGALQLLHHRKPVGEVIRHVRCILTFCSIEPNFSHIPISIIITNIAKHIFLILLFLMIFNRFCNF